MNSDVFCPLPWVLQATRNDGVFRVCAHAQNSPCRGEARNQGESLEADKAIWSEARNANSLKTIRADFLQNKWPEACQRCHQENKSGVSSRQAEELKRYAGVFEKEQALAVTREDGEIVNFGPRELDLRFGNRCNVKCVMCSPKSSALWYKDQYQVWGPEFKNWKEEPVTLTMKSDRLEASSTFDQWYDSDHFLEQVAKQLTDVQKIHFSGGEPLLIQRFYDVLDVVIQSGRSQEITIETITNGTLLPDKLIELFPHFKKVNVGVSIDAVGEKNDYIRFPTKWKTVLSVLDKLEQTPDNVEPWIATTFMSYNILDIPEMMEWRDEMNFKKVNNNFYRMIFMDHPLHNPGHLSAQIFPREVKLYIAEKLNAYLENKTKFRSEFLSAHSQQALANMTQIIHSQLQMMVADDKSHLLPKFFKYTTRLDMVRKNSFWNTFPELASQLRPYYEMHDARRDLPNPI